MCSTAGTLVPLSNQSFSPLYTCKSLTGVKQEMNQRENNQSRDNSWLKYGCQVWITERDEVALFDTIQAALMHTAHKSDVQPKQKIDA